MRAALCIWSLAYAAQLAQKVTPAEKIINLLTDLKSEAEAELEQEQAVMEGFLEFCGVTLEEKADAIKDDNLNIETANGGIESAKAGIEQAQADFAEATKKVNEKTAALAERTNNWNKQKAELEATEADLTKAVRNLEGAIEHLNASKSTALTQESKEQIKHNLELAKVLGLGGKLGPEGVALLTNDPGDYEYHSGGIIKLLDLLAQDFQKKLNDTIDEITKEQENYDEYKASTEAFIETEKDNARQAKDRENEEKENLGGHEQNLGNASIDLTNDTQYHTSLDERCATKKKEWAQREQGRKDEIHAIGEALKALDTALATEAGRARKDSFLQSNEQPIQRHVLHQRPIEEDRLTLPTNFLQVNKVFDVSAYLEKMGHELQSSTLLTMAMKATGPFEKVKKLIQALIERLLDEAANEARSQGKCATELAEARTNRQHRAEEITRVNAELHSLEANRDQLEVQLGELETAIRELEDSLAKETELRGEDKANNLAAVKSAQEGLVATGQAITILKEYYHGKHGHGGAKDAKAFFQASPVDEEAEWQEVAHIGGAYKGAQNKANNIFGLLEVMKTDFQREIRTTKQDEKDTQAAYVIAKRDDSALLATKNTEQKNADTDLTMTKSTIKIRNNDLKSAVERRDKAIGILEVLHDKCVKVDMPWEERKAKIEREIEALKKCNEALQPKGP